MYSEELDTIERGIEAYGNDLRHIAVKICKKIANIGKTVTLDVSYHSHFLSCRLRSEKRNDKNMHKYT